MIEFGSDFHEISNYPCEGTSLLSTYEEPKLFASGRQCITVLIQYYKWKRIWCPQYFCYDVIRSIAKTGIEVKFYLDYPGFSENKTIETIPFEEGDVLLRMNYFGMREFRSERNIPIPVIEDHSHDLIGNWAKHSDASWCVASLRKSLPLAEGGILWSPRGYKLEKQPSLLVENTHWADERWNAMSLKRQYLEKKISDKTRYREIYVRTEDELGSIPLSLIDERSRRIVSRLDVESWYEQKTKNWELLSCMNWGTVDIMYPESKRCNMFSLVLLFQTEVERNIIREKLIQNNVYPAILWRVPNTVDESVFNLSERMLSIHCDSRYNSKEILELQQKIKYVICNDTNI